MVAPVQSLSAPAASTTVNKSAATTLTQGYHNYTVLYYNTGGYAANGAQLVLSWGLATTAQSQVCFLTCCNPDLSSATQCNCAGAKFTHAMCRYAFCVPCSDSMHMCLYKVWVRRGKLKNCLTAMDARLDYIDIGVQAYQGNLPVAYTCYSHYNQQA